MIAEYVQAPAHQGAIRKRISRFFLEQIPLIERLLQQGIDSGEFRQKIDPHKIALLFVTSLEGAVVLAETIGAMESMNIGHDAACR